MSNAFVWAAYISAAVVVGGCVLAAPGILGFRDGSAPNAFWMYAVLPLTIAAWWCAYYVGLGPQSPFNIVELFILAAIYVPALYALLIFRQRFQRQAVLPGVLLAVCLAQSYSFAC